jgi:holo-[acyl-carrier protein] synthase
MGVLGIGFDLVTVSEFAEQLDRPGTAMLDNFTPGERRDAVTRSSDPARHFAARWAAKEAVIKAWSTANFASPPVLPEMIHHLIEVVTDAWGRPSIRLRGDVAEHLTDVKIHISLTHDGDTAGAFAVIDAALALRARAPFG